MDLGSLNGTWRNDLLLKPNVRYELRPGDRIQVGSVKGAINLEQANSNHDVSTQLTQSPSRESTRFCLKDLTNTTNIANAEKSAQSVHSLVSQKPSSQDSNTSVNLLANIVINTDEVPEDLLPNASQYVSRSPSPSGLKLVETRNPLITPEPCLGHALLTEMLICETQITEGIDVSSPGTNMVYTEKIVAETEPFDAPDAVLTGKPTMSTHSVLRKLTEAVCSTTTASEITHPLNSPLSGRPSFNVVAVHTPVPHVKPAVSSTPYSANLSSTTPLVCDSEPGLHSNKQISSDFHSRCSELPETQPDGQLLAAESALFVNESEVFLNPGISLDVPSVNQIPHSPQSAVFETAQSKGLPGSTEPVSQVNNVLDQQKNRKNDPFDSRTSLVDHSNAPSEASAVLTLDLDRTPSYTTDHPIVIDQLELTQPMIILNRNIVSNVLSNSPTDPSNSTSFRQPISEPSSPTVDNLVAPIPFADVPVLSKPIPLDSSNERNELSELTQPMVQFRRVSLTSNRKSIHLVDAVDLDLSQEEYTGPLTTNKHIQQPSDSKSVTEPVSPTVDDLVSKSFTGPSQTPSNKPQITGMFARKSKTTVKRSHIGDTRRSIADRVSSFLLSNEIGVVHFRTRQRRRSSDVLIESDECQLESKELFDIPGASCGLVRRASQVFTGSSEYSGLSYRGVIKLKSVEADKLCKSTNSRTLRIPSPVLLPDSILSEDPSQLDDSASRSHNPVPEPCKPVLHPVIRKLTIAGETTVNLKSSATGLSASLDTERLVPKSTGGPSPRSAVLLAGFDESPQEIDSKVTSVVAQARKEQSFTPVPLVDLSSFSDLAQHSQELDKRTRKIYYDSDSESLFIDHISPIRKTTTRRNAHALNVKKTLPAKASRKSTQRVSVESPSEAAAFIGKPAKRSRLSTTSERQCLPPVRRSKRISCLPVMHVTVEPESPPTSTEKVSTSRRTRISALAERDPTYHPQVLMKRSKQPRSKTMKNRTSTLSRACPSLNETNESSLVILERCDPVSHTKSDQIHLLFSGVDSRQFERVLPLLGASETGDYLLASHLVTDQWKRTLKMLYARARDIPIVSVDWLIACNRCRKGPYPDPLAFRLSPPHTATAEFVPDCPSLSGDNSSRSSSRRSGLTYRKSFMSGWSVRSTSAVLPPAADLARLTQLAGGFWMSDSDLDRAVKTQPARTVLIATVDEWSAVRGFSSARKPKTGTLKLTRSVKNALRSLPCVTVEWFLQAVMTRVPPAWPVDKNIQIH
ncbi:hypothetical protein EG68_05387 [Paragonimus skrjabini miyazakii]|uniref:BRCT domain-containing protein n=1 Tax=Paragonimus skrjabini miyazakii TaxID=59628 RepID=A0A8S9YYU0_9TREM|nr:hypothetical protein EG68_05387 [Paragonimus skrjabini miyazakii]